MAASPFVSEASQALSECDFATKTPPASEPASRAASLLPELESVRNTAQQTPNKRSRKSKGQLQLWRSATAVTDRAASLGYTGVAALCGNTFLPPDRLRKAKRLGDGTFAVVDTAQLLPDAAGNSHWPSSSPQDGKLPVVAVKRLKPHVLDSEDAVVAFIQEARLLLKLQHPSIIGYIGLGCDDDLSREVEWRTMYLVQEYASGGTLKNLILAQMVNPRKQLYTLADAVCWGCQVAQGLAFLHGQNPMILHRDLKADNVLLVPGESGQLHAKLADFGLHRQVPCEDIKLGLGERRYHMTGQAGTFAYMAPEVVLGTPYNEKVDVFSFGMVLYELVHRRWIPAELARQNQDARLFGRKVAGGYRLSIGPQVPPTLAQLVEACLAGSPEQRPSMAEVVRRLQELQASGELEASKQQQIPTSQAGCCTIM